MSESIDVQLSRTQLKRLEKGLKIRVSYEQLTRHNTTLTVSAAEAKKIARAIRLGKGVQLDGEQIHEGEPVEGAGIGKAFKKFGHAIEKGVNKGAKYVHKNAGDWVERAKKFVPQEMIDELAQQAIESGITAAAAMSGQPELLATIPMAKRGASKGIDMAYKHDFKKPLPSKNDAIKYVGKKAIGALKDAAEEKLNITFPTSVKEAGRELKKQARSKFADYVDSQQVPGDEDGDGFAFEAYDGSGLFDSFIAKNYNPVAQAVLRASGDKNIIKLQIVRTPLAAPLTTAINIASMGKYAQEAAKDAAGKFYHLNANVYTSDNKAYTVEKTEVVTLKPGATPTRGAEVMDISNIPAGLSLNKLMSETQRVQGSKFWTYSASSNNCQYFLRDMLQGNGLSTPSLLEFVKQATEGIFKGNATLRKAANSATNLAAAASNVMSNPLVSKFVSLPNFKQPKMPKLFGKSAAPIGESYGRSAAPIGGRSAAPIGGAVVLRRVKGSQEARDHMAMLRSKRKNFPRRRGAWVPCPVMGLTVATGLVGPQRQTKTHANRRQKVSFTVNSPKEN